MSENDEIKPSSLIPVDIEEEMKRSYLDYAMSVIIGRALPDVRDGMKPVHRRVLYGMWDAGNRAGKPYKKSARIVGDVMGKYHPHGDAAIYDTVVRMAQPFSMRYTLVDGQGNFGSVDGDNPAAMRYTEVRLTRLAEEMLRDDIDKNTVEWVPNYDGHEMEPQVLPAAVPNLLLNGSSGIAVGMATNIPPHNLGELIDSVEMLIDRPESTVEDIMTVIPGPDFPTAGMIHGAQGIHSAYTTGRGIIRVRARAEIVDLKGDKNAIILTELPFQVNKARLVEKIAQLVKTKKVDGITALRDESDRKGMRVVIELRRDIVPEIMLNSLYKHTAMQSSFGMNMLAIVDQQPKVLNLKEILEHYLDHRKTVVIRRTRFDLAKAEARAHILEGILKALDHLDEIITTIRASATPDEARGRLMEVFDLTRIQAQAILDMRLQKLTGLERDKVIEEFKELMAIIERLSAILNSDQLVLEEIRSELHRIKDKYADPRRTEIIASSSEITIEDLIADDDMVITVTQSGYIKRSPLAVYRAQARGGKGRMGMKTKEEDVVESVFVASAHSYILVFTQDGRVFWLKVHQIPELGPTSRGKAIVNLLQLSGEDSVATVLAVREFDDHRHLLFVTEKGTVKKTVLSAYGNPRANGIRAIHIDDDDRLLRVRLVSEDSEVFLATRNGFAIRFRHENVRAMGRTARGVRGIYLREGDLVVSVETLSGEGTLLTIAQNGYGKRTDIEEYRLQTRGGKGIINLKLSEKTGPVIAVREVVDDDQLVIVTQDGKLIRIPVAGISIIGRSTQGVKVMDLGGEDRIVAVARVPAEEAEEIVEGEEGEVLEGTEPEPDPTTPPNEPIN